MSSRCYSLFETDRNGVKKIKSIFRSIYNKLFKNYKFNELLFAEENPEPLV